MGIGERDPSRQLTLFTNIRQPYFLDLWMVEAPISSNRCAQKQKFHLSLPSLQTQACQESISPGFSALFLTPISKRLFLWKPCTAMWMTGILLLSHQTTTIMDLSAKLLSISLLM